MGTLKSGLAAAVCLAATWVSLGQDVNPTDPFPPLSGSDAAFPAAPAEAPADPGAAAAATDPAAPIEATTAAPAEPAAPKQPAPPKKKAAPKLPTARGSVAAIDKVAMTLIVEAKGKEHVFQITSKTRVFADKKPATVGDGAIGDSVTVEYRNVKGKPAQALTVRYATPK